MATPDSELRQRLKAFADRWSAWTGSEKSEAIPFLIELLECYGTHRDETGVQFEVKSPSGFIDNEVDDGAYADLRAMHRALDQAVSAAYEWPGSVAFDPEDSNRRLLELNRRIVAGELHYDPFVSAA